MHRTVKVVRGGAKPPSGAAEVVTPEGVRVRVVTEPALRSATRPGKLIVAPGCGTASTFGNLSGMSRTEADAFLRSLYPARVDTTRSGAYTEYRFADGSKVWIEQATGHFGASAARAELLPHHLTDHMIAGVRVQTNATNNDELIGEDMPLAVDI